MDAVTKRAKREEKNKTRCSAFLRLRATIREVDSVGITSRYERVSLVYYGLPYEYGRRTGRAQFGLICYVPQAKLKVMGGV